MFPFRDYNPSGDSNGDYYLFKLLELSKEKGGYYNPVLTGGQLPNGGFDNIMKTGGSFLGVCELEYNLTSQNSPFLPNPRIKPHSELLFFFAKSHMYVIPALQFTRSMPAFPAEGYFFVKGPGSSCLPLHYIFPKHASWTDKFNSMLLALREAGFDQTLYRR